MSEWKLLDVQFAQSWMEGIGAVGTVSAAWYAALAYRRSRRDMLERQVRLITIAPLEDEHEVKVRIINNSDAPIFDVQLIEPIRINGKAIDENPHMSHSYYLKIMPGEDVDLATTMLEEYLEPESLEGHTVEFMDAYGVKWLKSVDDNSYHRKSGGLRYVLSILILHYLRKRSNVQSEK